MKWVLGASIFAIAMGWAATTTIPAATVSIDEGIFKFLPPETQGIVVIDVAGLRNASLVRDVLKDQKLTVPREWDEFAKATGTNPELDIDKVTIGKLNSQDALVIVQGRIDKFKIEQFLKDKGKQPQAYLGRNLYLDGDGAFVLLDNVAVLGKINAVKKAVDQMQLPGASPLRGDLMAAIQTIEAGNQVWGVGDFSVNDLGTLGVRGPAPAVELLKPLKSGTYQMRVDTGIHARAIGNFTDADSAKNIVDLARGALAVAKMQIAKQQPDMLQLLDGIQVNNSGATLTVRIEEAGDLLMKLKEFRGTPVLK